MGVVGTAVDFLENESAAGHHGSCLLSLDFGNPRSLHLVDAALGGALNIY